MKSRIFTKLTLDIILTVLFIVIIYPRETGFTFHEIAGLSIGALLIFHIILNWSWVKSVTRNLFNPKLNSKTKLFYLLNMLSLVVVTTIIITGIQISEVLFPVQGMISHTTVLVHKWAAYSGLVIFGLHLALHWRFFTQTVPRAFRTANRPWGKIALNMGAVVLAFGLLYTQISGCADQPVDRQKNTSSSGYEDRLSDDSLPSSNSSGSSNNSSGATIESNPPVSSSTSGSGPSSSGVTSSDQPEKDNSISGTTSGSGSNSISTGSSSNDTQTVSLEQFLGGMFCNGCDKHCCLLTPRCDRGFQQQEAAKQEYQAQYGIAVTD